MITTIMFDLDGTLVDAKDWHFRALNKALQDVAGFEITPRESETTFCGQPTRVKLKALADVGRLDPSKFDSIFNLKQYYTMMMIRDYCRPDPIKISMMVALRGYRKACVTNCISKTAYEMLVLSGLNRYLDYVQGNEATRYPKPSAAPYLHAMAYMNVSPDKVLAVEDNHHGIESAHGSGARVLEITYDTLTTDKIMEALK